jgi:uncharacterized protein YdhG (YjbR/CyaY superfamily)
MAGAGLLQIWNVSRQQSFVEKDSEHMRILEVDAYILNQPEPKRSTLSSMRDMMHELVPGTVEVIGHGVPYFTLRGKKYGGIAACKKHMLYFTQSSAVIHLCADVLQGFTHGNASVQFPIDRPLERNVLERLITLRIGEIG